MDTPVGRSSGRLAQAKETVQAMREDSKVVDLGFTLVTRPNFANDTLLASYIAMRIFVLLFPLAYTAIVGFGLYGSSASQDPSKVVDNAGLTGALAASVASAAQGSSKGHVVVFVVGVVLSVWTGRSAARAMRLAHASIWRVPVPKLPLAELSGFFFAAMVLVLAWLGAIVTRLRHAGAPIGLTSIAFAVILGAIWLEVSWHLPHSVHRRRDLLPGAVLVGLGGPLLNLATQLYFAPKLSRVTTTYGVLGGSLVFITYLLVVAWTIVAGAELSAGVMDWRRRQGEPSDGS